MTETPTACKRPWEALPPLKPSCRRDCWTLPETGPPPEGAPSVLSQSAECNTARNRQAALRMRQCERYAALAKWYAELWRYGAQLNAFLYSAARLSVCLRDSSSSFRFIFQKVQCSETNPHSYFFLFCNIPENTTHQRRDHLVALRTEDSMLTLTQQETASPEVHRCQ
ncbi:hypothetical protein JZ751_002468 [Albula glossodonta]|uniref:Uncharacterized protein n=1 Tax=Albula glossodonta TaxID=121402 RepID=A0A8T2NBH1_9TELE|nr:hypothetical protein JZ751_002468 [Albula glossodonta]